jgi:hypothetical protein
MVRNLVSVALLAASLLASGCSSTLKATTLDASGRFPTGTLLDPSGVKVNKPFNDKFKPMLYVKIDDSKVSEYRDFFVSSFANTGIFGKVQRKEQLEQMVIERNLSTQVSNISDLIGLNNLARQIGPFLVVEPSVEWKGGYDYVASVKAVDPENGETVLHLEQKAFNWAGLDKPLFYPLFNGFVEWAKGQTIQTRVAAKR